MTEAFVLAGYPYEFVGLLYYVFFLLMGRRGYAPIYSRRSRLLTLSAAIVLVGCVPFHYASLDLGVFAMIGLALVALLSTLFDAFAARRRR